MAIKWKNNKLEELRRDKSIQLAAVIIIIAALFYFSLFPSFRRAAEENREDPFISPTFVEMLYKSNYIFYQDIREKSDGVFYQKPDLYLQKTDIPYTDQDTVVLNEDTMVYSQNQLLQLETELRNNIESQTVTWQQYFTDALAGMMDYCVIDNLTGAMIKNTGNPLEEAASPADQRSDQWKDAHYKYFYLMEYDNLGKVSKVSVSVTGMDAETLLKEVQKLGRTTYLDPFNNDSEVTRIYYCDLYGDDADTSDAKVSGYRDYQISGPQNVTFIYGITEKQVLASEATNTCSLYDPTANNASLDFNNSYNDFRYYYYNSNALSVYMYTLIVLAALALILPYWKKETYHLQDYTMARLPLEVNIVVLIIIMSFGSNVVTLMSNYNNGHLFSDFKKRLPWFFPDFLAKTLDRGTVLLCLLLLFGIWYLCATSFADIKKLGFINYIRQRSVSGNFWRWCKNKIIKFYRQLIRFDIGKDANRTIVRILILNFCVVSILCCMFVAGIFAAVFYSIGLYILIKKYIRDVQEQYQKLLKATSSIAQGRLDTALSEDFGIFESYKEELIKIQTDFKQAVEEEVKSQRMKTELITNVSHDLKTPLTAITTYTDLLKNENLTEEERSAYIRILEQKSQRLKILIEDLFEVSKATTGNVALNIVNLDICNLMRQVYLEYQDKIEDAGLTFRFLLPDEKIILPLDSAKTYRIFENLYTNIIKYAMTGTRVYLSLTKDALGGVHIEIKNIASYEMNIDPEELTERFVRADGSRNSEGSGLGLAIAKSFTELQKGRLSIEIDGDLFKVHLDF